MECGNPGRGAHQSAMSAARVLLEARMAIAEFFGVRDPARVIFTHNATMALNIAIAGLEGHVTTTAAEHNSVLRPLHRRGNYSVAPLDERGRLDPDRLELCLRGDTGAVVMSHASNVCGNVYDVKAVANLCRRRRIRLVVDAAQSAGLLPVDVDGSGISALCFSGHKSLCGPQGVGCVCLGEDFFPPPLVVGGSGSDSLSALHPARLPDALEAGTQNLPGVAGLLAGVGHVRSLAGEQFVRPDSLARDFIREVRGIDGLTLYGDIDAQLRLPVVALNLPGVDAARLAALLEERYNIAVRAGVHCAPLMHRTFGTESTGSVRFSFSHDNTPEEATAAVAALREIAAAGRRGEIDA